MDSYPAENVQPARGDGAVTSAMQQLVRVTESLESQWGTHQKLIDQVLSNFPRPSDETRVGSDTYGVELADRIVEVANRLSAVAQSMGEVNGRIGL